MTGDACLCSLICVFSLWSVYESEKCIFQRGWSAALRWPHRRRKHHLQMLLETCKWKLENEVNILISVCYTMTCNALKQGSSTTLFWRSHDPDENRREAKHFFRAIITLPGHFIVRNRLTWQTKLNMLNIICAWHVKIWGNELNPV